MPKPMALGADELIRSLRSRGPVLIEKFFRPEPDLERLIQRSVMGNTFRAFHKLKRQPSLIFREWATTKMTARKLSELSTASGQKEFDRLHRQLAADLARYWLAKGKKPIAFGPSMKLTALLLKSLTRWSGLSASCRDRMIGFLPVPLDSYSLLAIRDCAASGRFGPPFRIPSNATMGFIDSQEHYTQIHDLARSVAKEAGVSPICLDLVAWDGAHAERELSLDSTYQSDCPFCKRPAPTRLENAAAIAFLDSFPVAEGHTLVVPKRHVVSLFDLPEKELAAVWKLVAQVRAKLLADIKPDGFNIGVNNGLAAGQTVMHAHVHVIPRRSGDVADPRGGVRWVIPGKAPYGAGDFR
jgi:diadenosine tetraphosphate (Ap4A) HIT family hydrolase